MNSNISIIALAALLFVGCSSDNQVGFENPDIIKVVAELPGGSRATLTEFENGDKMGLYAVEYNGEEVAPVQVSGNYLNNEPLVYQDEEWSSARTLYWSDKKCDFYGIYPYRELPSLQNVLFEVATDQSTLKGEDALGGYEASDLMWAKAEGVSREDGQVNLQYKHLMSRVIVKIERGANYEGELPQDIVVHLYNTATTAKVDWVTGNLEKYMYSDNKTITMRQLDGNSFDAIVVPQFIERSTPLVEITMQGIAYLLEMSMSFRPAMQHTITVTLHTSPVQEKLEISIDGTIDDWTN